MTGIEIQARFQGLMEAHKGILYKISRGYAKSADDREDLAQEIAVQLWRSFRGFDEGRSKFSTWMYRIALNVAISQSRRDSTRARYVLADGERLLAETAASDGPSDELTMLYGFIDELDAMNKALVLLYLDGNDYREIAAVLGLSETNVATKINRLKKSLREKVL
jgi:RNA polymerase sigma factor (sigma-70 family)